MGTYEITGQFTDKAEMLTIDTRGHADVFNALYRMLFNNDVFLKREIENAKEILANKADGSNISFGIEEGTLVMIISSEPDDTQKVYKIETSNVVSGVLQAGETELTLSDECITEDSTVDIYTDCYGVNPKTVEVIEGSITMTFKARTENMKVKVVVK